jgi:hypothetical protein
MAKDIQKGILGDIRPENPSRPDTSGRARESIVGHEHDEAMEGGSRHDESRRPGSRDMTTGGVGTETGGSRNYRQGSGASGGDIGNRPE